ncbi:restriction endonuclease subunit S [Vibrio vulnificus]|uniref:restriction endonuclease subunit S n=1 Tax=Vibrio vulnificus TaxID=672 RepID=UPI0007211DAA|nr:restriction endonuclease subunit S [Vibrio vulnificus]ALM71843.1 Type I restriction-modification system, specificity subunit S [Vibrio vulnificus]ANH62357.1 Type I restriction-modification system, specificity subunit S [Vibrio vulnificus]
MRSNYKKLGQFIKEVSVKNKDLSVELLLGVSITKQFIPSIANTVGTDMSKYKVVEHHQFAYGPVTSRNGEKISVALLSEEKCIVSTSYTVFEIVDTELLDPEYLMMWFRRSEFDRYARYMSHGTVRELFGWQEMCDVELPVPSIEKQREIVREYNVVNDRIALNEQLTQKLEDTAQAIYKQWFVDFEFPISKEYAESIGKPELEGKPYKYSGGEMEYCEVFESEMPSIWQQGTLEQLVQFSNGKKKPSEVGDFPIYGGNGVLGYAAHWNYENILAIGRVGHYCGSLFRVFGKCWISDNAICGKSITNHNNFCYYLLKSLKLNEKSEGTGQPLLTQGILKSIPVGLPRYGEISAFEQIAEKTFSLIFLYQSEVASLTSLRTTLLSKMTKF